MDLDHQSHGELSQYLLALFVLFSCFFGCPLCLQWCWEVRICSKFIALPFASLENHRSQARTCHLLIFSKQRQRERRQEWRGGTSDITHQLIKGRIGAHTVLGNTRTVGGPCWKSPSQSTGTSTVAEFMVPWEPLFVKCLTGSPDTGPGEDEFPFRAVSLLTPLILGVLMMNFFLFFYFIYFHSNSSSHCPETVWKEQNRWYFSWTPEGSWGYKAGPLCNHMTTRARKNLDFPWETQMQWY